MLSVCLGIQGAAVDTQYQGEEQDDLEMAGSMQVSAVVSDDLQASATGKLFIISRPFQLRNY